MIPAVAVSMWHVLQVCSVLRSPRCFRRAARPEMLWLTCLWQRGFRSAASELATAQEKASPSTKKVADNSIGFVLPGPRLTFAERAQCIDQLRAAAGSAQFAVVGGSLPPGVPADFYQQVADICSDVGTRLILDTSGTGLQRIPSGVFLLKPSVRELRECVERELATEAEQTAAAQELVQHRQAQVVVVSLGHNGALLITPDAVQRVPAIMMRSGSGVGAGDAMVAAITVGLSRGWPLAKSVRFGVAAGAAMLMTPGTAVCHRADVERLFELVAEPTDLSAMSSCDRERTVR
jgi:6-phosphofructokinase 2